MVQVCVQASGWEQDLVVSNACVSADMRLDVGLGWLFFLSGESIMIMMLMKDGDWCALLCGSFIGGVTFVGFTGACTVVTGADSLPSSWPGGQLKQPQLWCSMSEIL
jgi:hypothetical protein